MLDATFLKQFVFATSDTLRPIRFGTIMPQGGCAMTEVGYALIVGAIQSEIDRLLETQRDESAKIAERMGCGEVATAIRAAKGEA